MIKKILRFVALLPALMFLFLGGSWLLDADKAAANMGIPVIEGIARSNMMGDVGSFFFAGGCIILMGVITLQRNWFYCAALLLGFAAIFRTLGWLLQDAPFIAPAIIIEVVLTIVMLLCAHFACEPGDEVINKVS